VPRDAIAGSRAVLSGRERHHLRVRRIRVGMAVELFDERGREFDAVVTALTPDGAELALTERPFRSRESSLRLTLAVALLKADKLDLVVEKATELGVAQITLLSCAHTVRASASRRLERLHRIAVTAAKQSGRSRVPAIEGPEPVATAVTRSADLRLFCWEGAAGTNAPWPDRANVASVLVAVGPEGGFSEEEAGLMREAGFHAVSLGPRILRAETAAIAAVALAQTRWGDLGGGLA
jgi:16S rRNA (uracil1498-N3)-methyltransferase